MRHVSCGALSAYITNGENPDATAIAARIERGQPWYFLPFGRIPADRLVALDESRFIALATSGEGAAKCIAVFDAFERKQLSETIADADLTSDSKFLVSRNGDRLVHLFALGCRCWSLPELAELWTRELPLTHIAEAVERDDGWIVVRGSNPTSPPNSAEQPCLAAVSPDGEESQIYEPESELEAAFNHDSRKSSFKLSGGGRWLERAHDGSVLATDANGSPIAKLHALADIDDERLIEALKAVHIHGVREIWGAAPFAFHTRIVVRSMPLYDALAEKPVAEGVHAELRLEEARQNVLALKNQGADEETLGVARAEVARFVKLRNDFARARWALKWLARFTQLAPHDGWRPGDPAFFDRLPKSETYWVEQQFLQPLNVARGSVSSWEAGDQALVLRFSDGWRRRVGVDGALAELERAPPEPPAGQDETPSELKAGATQFLRAISVPTIRLGRLDEYNCVRAIEDVTVRIRSGVHNVVWGRRLTLRFTLTDGELTEKQFFDFVGGNCEGAAASLRQLLGAYDRAAKSNDVWSDEGVSAMGYAALALARLDPEAHTALEGYFRRRDPRVETFGREHILPALAETTGSFGNIGALRFALQRLPEEELAAGMGDTLAQLIIRGARSCCTPGRLVSEIERAARSMMWGANIEMWSLAGNARSMTEVWGRMAAEEQYVREGLVLPLLRAADPVEDWDFTFMAKARRRRIRYPQTPFRWVDGWRRVRQTVRQTKPDRRATSARQGWH